MEQYKYLDDINEAVLRNLPVLQAAEKKMVLDIGCGTGALAGEIRKKGYAVWGIDQSDQASRAAASRVERIITGDLTDIAFVRTALKDTLFDHLIFADVLEHLTDPWTILKQYAPLLKHNGTIIVSLPNTVVWSKRIKFLFGNFDYTATGVLDRDHLRFFTLKSAKNLVISAGYDIIKVDHAPYFVRAIQPLIKKILLGNKKTDDSNRRALIDSPFYRFYMKFIYPVEYAAGYFFRSLFAFKIVIVARRSSDPR